MCPWFGRPDCARRVSAWLCALHCFHSTPPPHSPFTGARRGKDVPARGRCAAAGHARVCHLPCAPQGAPLQAHWRERAHVGLGKGDDVGLCDKRRRVGAHRRPCWPFCFLPGAPEARATTSTTAFSLCLGGPSQPRRRLRLVVDLGPGQQEGESLERSLTASHSPPTPGGRRARRHLAHRRVPAEPCPARVW